MPTPQPPPDDANMLAAWAARARQAGWAETAAAVLDMFAPLSIFGAQCVWAAAPFARAFGPSVPWNGIAAALERPGGAAALRALLLDDALSGTPDAAPDRALDAAHEEDCG